MNKTLLVTALSLAFGLNAQAQTTDPSTTSSPTVSQDGSGLNANDGGPST